MKGYTGQPSFGSINGRGVFGVGTSLVFELLRIGDNTVAPLKQEDCIIVVIK